MAAGLELFGFVLLQLPRLLGSEISGANRVSRRCAESISGRRVADKHLHPAISSAYIFTSNTNRHARIRTLIITHTHLHNFTYSHWCTHLTHSRCSLKEMIAFFPWELAAKDPRTKRVPQHLLFSSELLESLEHSRFVWVSPSWRPLDCLPCEEVKKPG